MGSAAVAIKETADHWQNPGWAMICSLVLDGITSPHTHRAYAQALEEFLIWFHAEHGQPFSKATVQRYRRELEMKGLAASSINVRLAAIRRLARGRGG
jgi:site-specific recombinase XerD